MNEADADATKADRLLAKYEGMPSKALWTALTGSNKQVAMAIVKDTRCGLERRMRREEGPFVKEPFRVDGSGSTPVMLAAAARRLDVLAELINAGADVNAVEQRFGYSALHYAVLADHLAAIELLVYHGADINALSQTAKGETALHLSVLCLHFEVTTLLLGLGANVNALNWHGEGALHTASWLSDRSDNGVAVMALLIGHGADLSLAGRDLSTPLHYAAHLGNIAAIEVLLCEGADPRLLDKNGNTPLRGFEGWLNKPVSAVDADRIRALLDPNIPWFSSRVEVSAKSSQ